LLSQWFLYLFNAVVVSFLRSPFVKETPLKEWIGDFPGLKNIQRTEGSRGMPWESRT
jgi:hypothetical protein